MLSGLRPGTHLWVFDVDIDHCRCEPFDAAFHAFTDLVQAFCDRNSVEIRTGTMLPPILEACGFEIEEVAVEPFNNREIDVGRFADYLLREALLYHYCLYGTPRDEDLRPLADFLRRRMTRDSHFVQYGMVMVSAMRRPF
jgi:hypothetical protein